MFMYVYIRIYIYMWQIISVLKSLWSSCPKMTLACFCSAIVPIAYPAAGKRVVSLQRVRARHLNHQLL